MPKPRLKVIKLRQVKERRLDKYKRSSNPNYIDKFGQGWLFRAQFKIRSYYLNTYSGSPYYRSYMWDTKNKLPLNRIKLENKLTYVKGRNKFYFSSEDFIRIC